MATIYKFFVLGKLLLIIGVIWFNVFFIKIIIQKIEIILDYKQQGILNNSEKEELMNTWLIIILRTIIHVLILIIFIPMVLDILGISMFKSTSSNLL